MIEVVVALIGAIALVTVATLQVRTNGRVKEITHQVSNDHATSDHPNLREDLDAKHDDMTELVTNLVTNLSRDIGGIRAEIRELRAADAQLSGRIDDATHPRKRILEIQKEAHARFRPPGRTTAPRAEDPDNDSS